MPDIEAINDINLKRFYIESYGCQMNFSDSEIVASILADCQYQPTRDIEKANLILLNTCSIREKAEETIRKRLRTIDKIKIEPSRHDGWNPGLHGRAPETKPSGGRKTG